MGLNVGAISVAASVAIAVLRSGQSADQGSNLQAAGLTVESHLNRAFTPNGVDVTQDADKDTARAVLETGVGGLFTAAANIAEPMGAAPLKRSPRPIPSTCPAPAEKCAWAAMATRGSNYIYNISSPLSAITAAASQRGLCQGEFTAELQIPAGRTVHAGSVNVEPTLPARLPTSPRLRRAWSASPAQRSTRPSRWRVQARAALCGVNGAGGELTTGALKVAADGESYARRRSSPVLTAANITVAANVIVAAVRSEQDSKISHVTVSILRKGNVTVTQAQCEKDGNRGAILGGMGRQPWPWWAQVNLAVALADGRSRAELDSASILDAGAIGITSSGNTVAHARPARTISVGLASVGINVLKAKANGRFDAIADVTGATITANTLKVSPRTRRRP